jgi:hypothetical protein
MNLRQAAEMALEALEIWEKMQPNTSASAVRVPAIQTLRQALAEPDEVLAEREVLSLKQLMSLWAWKVIVTRCFQRATTMR